MEKEFKTPSYMRKCYKTYYNKNKDDETFKNNRRESQRRYYEKNKEKVLEKMRQKRQLMKENNDKFQEFQKVDNC